MWLKVRVNNPTPPADLETMILEVRDLHVEVSGKPVLKGVNLSVGFGETIFLLGPNGSGKTSLIQTILGNPAYRILKGKIFFHGLDITEFKPESRVKLGIAASFQMPPKIKGLKACRLVEEVSKRFGVSTDEVKSLASALRLQEFMDRELYVGFSGGEVKRFELLLTLLQKPKLILLDEPDSGVDVENLAVIGDVLNRFLQSDGELISARRSALIVTHTGAIARYVKPSRAYIVMDGEVFCYGRGEGMVDRILRDGFKKCRICYERRGKVEHGFKR